MKIQSKLFLCTKSWSNLSHNSQFCASVKQISCRRRTKRWIHLFTFVILFIAYLHFFTGVFYRFFEKDFHTSFEYPENIPDFPQFIQNYKVMERTLNVSNLQMGQSPSPINQYYSSVEFLKRANFGCSSSIGLLIIVKSAPMNFEKRSAVRSTWGHPSYLKNNSISANLPTKLVFIVGQPDNESGCGWLHKAEQIDRESSVHDDIISASFTDTYNNNTYKSISALRWAKEICSDFRYLFLVDDDMFISLKNLLLLLRSPTTYELNFPDLQIKHSTREMYSDTKPQEDFIETNLTTESYKGQLFLGRDFRLGTPIRNVYGRNSKWFLSLADYPYNYLPSYVPGMAIVFSKSTVIDFVYASLFTRHLYIDDVYLGILAHKLKINITHSDYFIMLNKWKKEIKWTEYMIAVHSYTPESLLKIWNDNVLNF